MIDDSAGSRSDASSTDYYEEHAQAFFAATAGVDLAPLYAHFLREVPAGGRILDAGCGSRRDACAFVARGYQVAACDASPALARLASVHCGFPVRVLRFQELDGPARFDGIRACVSLLRVPLRETP